MTTKQLLDIEVEGMCKTILEACTDNFVKSYCHQLIKLQYPEDEEHIKQLIPRITSWYDEGNLRDIIDNKYAISKNQHLYTYELLNTLIKDLKIEYTKPKMKPKKEVIPNNRFNDIDWGL